MPTFEQFKLPDAGEGLTEAEIVQWHVAVGDEVTVNQTIVEIETAKSLVELPSPYTGVVAELLVAEGDTVEVGVPIIVVDTDPSGAPSAGAPAAEPAAGESSGSGAVLVGYGVAEQASARRPRRGASVAAASPAGPTAEPVSPAAAPAAPVAAPAAA
ncbi:biotin/lipoyl-containing protein, partial [Oerskovia enterophila]|uniref:biotin/lipoyl-containing protein n=1 Tax=Oerskovia enterophila TaxID=43678 RepID=UPI002F909818